MRIPQTISRIPLHLRRQLWPLLLGAAAATALSLPPLHVTERVDGMFYDVLANWRVRPAPGDVVLVDLSDPAWLSVLADMTTRAHSRVLVTTLAQPPSPSANEMALGPTEIPLGGPLIRRTEWAHGGHIEFIEAVDGRVRALPVWLDADRTLPALPLKVLESVHESPASFPRTALIGFSEPADYLRLTPQLLQAGGAPLTDRIVVAGRPEPRFETPVGRLAAHELVAQAVQSWRDGTIATTQPLLAALPWALALAALAAMAGRAAGGERHLWLWPAGGLTITLAGSAASLALASIWVPVAASQSFLLTAACCLRRPGRIARRPEPDEPLETDSIHAALEAGDIEQAWHHIQSLPADRANLDTMCDLGDALKEHRYLELAAETYYRAAMIDPYHRDAARKLVRVSRTDEERQPAFDSADRDGIPDRLGRFQLLEPIGRGSTGLVFLAIDPDINRLVALKVVNLRAEYDADSLQEGLDRFRREAESAGRLNHPNIVTIFDIGERDGLAYIAMEYLKGRHLSHFTAAETLLPVPLVLQIGAEIADALDFAHARNVVHRDIKPGNIMYDSVSGAVTITDFGIARLIDVSRTRTGVVLGTPSFMAPEQLDGKNVNRHTDLFALGVTLYELLTGRLPFLGASMTKLMFVIANEPHPPITSVRRDLPASMDAVFDQALAKCPEDRFARGADMAAALRDAASQLA